MYIANGFKNKTGSTILPVDHPNFVYLDQTQIISPEQDGINKDSLLATISNEIAVPVEADITLDQLLTMGAVTHNLTVLTTLVFSYSGNNVYVTDGTNTATVFTAPEEIDGLDIVDTANTIIAIQDKSYLWIATLSINKSGADYYNGFRLRRFTRISRKDFPYRKFSCVDDAGDLKVRLESGAYYISSGTPVYYVYEVMLNNYSIALDNISNPFDIGYLYYNNSSLWSHTLSDVKISYSGFYSSDVDYPNIVTIYATDERGVGVEGLTATITPVLNGTETTWGAIVATITIDDSTPTTGIDGIATSAIVFVSSSETIGNLVMKVEVGQYTEYIVISHDYTATELE